MVEQNKEEVRTPKRKRGRPSKGFSPETQRAKQNEKRKKIKEMGAKNAAFKKALKLVMSLNPFGGSTL